MVLDHGTTSFVFPSFFVAGFFFDFLRLHDVFRQFGETAFLLMSANVVMVQMLLNNGANVNDKDIVCVDFLLTSSFFLLVLRAECCFFLQDGNTALMKAARKNYPEIVELLLNAGANTNTKNNVSADVVVVYEQLLFLSFCLLFVPWSKQHVVVTVTSFIYIFLNACMYLFSCV